MIELFFASVIAGIVSGAPFGVAGALVADAALAHNRKRLDMIILAAVAGNGLLAFFVSLGAGPIKLFFEKYESLCFLIAGMAVIILALFLGVGTALSREGTVRPPEAHGRSRRIIGHAAPAVGVFIITLLHPGSIATFLFLTAFFSLKFSGFIAHKPLFAAGIAVGSFFAFSPVGLLFWTIRKKADGFVRYFRYGLAVMLGGVGVYLLAWSR